MAKIDVRASAILAAVITASVLATNWVFGTVLKQAVTPLFSASLPQPVSALTGTIGQKLVAWMGGVVPLPEFMGMGIVSTYLSLLVMVLVGTWILDNTKVPRVKSFMGFNGSAGRIFSIILYATIPLYILLIGAVVPTGGLIVGFVMHATAVAFVATWIAGIAAKVRI